MTTDPVNNEATSSTIELEKKNVEKADETNAVPPPVPPKKDENEEKREIKEGPTEHDLIDEGALEKLSLPSRIGIIQIKKTWNPRYFVFGDEKKAYPLENLRLYYKKNIGKYSAPKNVSSTETPQPEVKEAKEEVVVKEEVKKEDKEEVKEEGKTEEVKEEIKKEVKEEGVAVTEITTATEPEATSSAAAATTTITTTTTTISTSVTAAVIEKSEDGSLNPKHILFTNCAHATKTGKGLLYYFKSKDNTKEPDGIINLKDVKDVQSVNHAGKDFCLKIITDHRVYELHAGSELAQKRWINTIKVKAEEAKQNPIVEDEDYKTAFGQIRK